MGIGTFASFTQARLAIYASQTGISVTGNNISNINTTGYTRQRLDQDSLYIGGADRYANKANIRTGQGVLCTGVSQLRDPYLDIRYRTANADVGYLDTKLGGLESIALYLDEVGKGEQTEGDDFGILAAKFSELAKALGQVTDQTGHEEFDIQVRSAAENLINVIHSYANALQEVYDVSVDAFKTDVTKVNTILTDIRTLNEEIRRGEIYGDSCLELRDHRNNLIDQLSEYVKINTRYTTEEISPGVEVERLIITLGDANPDPSIETDETKLIDGIYSAQLSISTPKANPDYNPDLKPGDADYDEDVTPFPYLDKDGNPTDLIDEAEMLEGDDNPNFSLTVSELRNKRDELLYTMNGPTTTIFKTKAEYDQALADYNAAHPEGSVVVAPNGDKTVTTFSSGMDVTGHIAYVMTTYTMVASQKVALEDNDIHGALQAERELLTENGEFTDTTFVDGTNKDTPLSCDPQAKSKRGIPYYQNCLDMLANRFAQVLNDANQGCLYDKDGNYIKTEDVTDANGETKTMGVPLTISYTDNGVTKEYTLNKDTKWDDEEVWDNLPPEVRTELEGKTGLTFTTTPENPGETKNGSAIINAYLKGETFDNTTGEMQAGTPRGIPAANSGPLFSNNGNGDDTTEITAKNISISNSWASNAVQLVKDYICAPGDTAPVSGESDNVLRMKALLDYEKLEYVPSDYFGTPTGSSDVMFKGTFGELWESMGALLANDQDKTTTNLQTSYEAALSIDTQRDSVSSVDFNDEAMNLMMYAKSYNAACRLMTTIDTVLDKLINNTGVTT